MPKISDDSENVFSTYEHFSFIKISIDLALLCCDYGRTRTVMAHILCFLWNAKEFVRKGSDLVSVKGSDLS